jgi:hypothetical protein
MFFFCNTLVYRPLFHLPRLKPIERTLFRSPFIMRRMGFNARQMHTGFYQTREGEQPFTAQTIAETFARATPADFLASQQAVLGALWDYCPGVVSIGGVGDEQRTLPHSPRCIHSEADLHSVCAGCMAR